MLDTQKVSNVKMFGGVSSKLFEQETVSCSALENESMETTNNDKLGKQKIFPSRKLNLWVKEALAGPGRRAEEYPQTGRELLEPECQQTPCWKVKTHDA